MRIRTAILATTIGGVLLTFASTAVVKTVQTGRLSTTVGGELDTIAKSQTDNSADGVYALLRSQHDLLSIQLERGLNVAREQIALGGGINYPDLTQGDGTYTWQATNQFTKQTTQIDLPKMLVGQTSIGQNKSFSTETPVVDETFGLVGGTTTIFQKMNDSGDLLRVATNVRLPNDTRAVGTYIPAKNPDGTPNVVASTIARGETYRGRAFVVDKWYLTVNAPMRDNNGEVVGELNIGVPFESVSSVRDSILSATIGQRGEVFVLGGTGGQRGDYIIAPEGLKDGDNALGELTAAGDPFIDDLIQGAIDAPAGQSYFTQFTLSDDTSRTLDGSRIVAARYFKDWDWVLVADADADELLAPAARISQTANSTLISSIVSGIVIAAIAGTLAFLVSGRITRRIGAVTESLSDMATGEADLTRRLDAEGKDELSELSHAFNGFIENIQGMFGLIVESTTRLDHSASGIVSEPQAATQSIERQTTSATNLNAMMGELQEAISMIAQRCSNASESALQAGEDAQEGNTLVSKTTNGISEIAAVFRESADAINRLGAKGEQIGEIVRVINDIAEQTNLLALNAAIEAARAGEHGRGFAVVADEVRKLAERTTTATDEIATSINSIREETSVAVEKVESGTGRVTEGLSLAENAGSKLGEIVAGSDALRGVINDIAAAAEELSVTVQSVSGSVEQGTLAANDSSQQIAEANSAATQVANETRKLAELVGRFKTS